jgi:hypothetical protein
VPAELARISAVGASKSKPPSKPAAKKAAPAKPPAKSENE